MTKKIFIAGMTCGHCASHVEAALKEVGGVKSAKVDLAGNFATVELAHEVDAEKIKAAVEEAGYEVVSIE
ncbi:MAG TPA: heavy-metal-associated domain-containing protein [Selenomonadales bacterium]|nr:heavy-metal-associated domain-containing protein [Selenomonadales bacterium]